MTNGPVPLLPELDVAIVVYVDVNDIRVATDRAIFHIFLRRASGRIHRDNDFLTAMIANVGGFIVHDWKIVALPLSDGKMFAVALRR